MPVNPDYELEGTKNGHLCHLLEKDVIPKAKKYHLTYWYKKYLSMLTCEPILIN